MKAAKSAAKDFPVVWAAALCGIQQVGGITIAQKPDTAGQPDMHENAIKGGCIDFDLSPENVAQEIVRIADAE